MTIIFFFPTSPGTNVSDMNYTVVVLGGVLGLSLVWYYLPVYGGVNWFTGPVKTVGKSGLAHLEMDKIGAISSESSRISSD